MLEAGDIVGQHRWLDLTYGQREVCIEAWEENPDGFASVVARTATADSPNGALMVKLAAGAHHAPKPPPPVRPWNPEPYSPSSPEYAARWKAIIRLVQALPTDHPWRKVHRLLVTQHVVEARRTGEAWAPTDEECYEILHLLEVARAEMVVEAPSEAPEPEPSLADLLARTKERT